MFTSVREKNGVIFYTGYDGNGKRIKGRDNQFKPYYFIKTTNPTKFKTFPDGQNVERIYATSVKKFHDETSSYPPGFVFGNIKNASLLQFIRENKLYDKFDPSRLRKFFFDIEVFSDKGFPVAEEANHPVVAITGRVEGEISFHLWYLSDDFEFSRDEWFFSKYPELKQFKTLHAVKDKVKPFKERFLSGLQKMLDDLLMKKEEMKKEFFENEKIRDEFKYWFIYVEKEEEKIKKIKTEIERINKIEKSFKEAERINVKKFKREEDLLVDFFLFHVRNEIDVLSGWNSESFDLPYLINRMEKFLPGFYKNLSPFKEVDKRTTFLNGKKKDIWEVYGVEHIDLLEADKKFRTNKRDSYKLNDVSIAETGLGKVEYNGSLSDLWINDKQKYLEYNIGDVECLEGIHGNLGYIDLIYSIAHYSRTAPNWFPFTTFIWEGHIFNSLLEKGYVISGNDSDEKRKIAGAFVKEPLDGLFGWVMSFDLTSLYPSIIRMCNMSHEMIVRKEGLNIIEETIKGEFDYSRFKEKNEICMPTGLVFSGKEKGIVAEIIEDLFIQRKKHKKESFQFKKEADKEEHDMVRKRELENKSKILDVIQLAEKVLLNSFYGATAVSSFALFNIHYAESITTMGQICNRYCSDRINNFLNEIFKTKDVDYIIAGDTDSIYVNVQTFVDKNKNLKTDEEIVNYLNNIAEKLIEPKIAEIYKEMTDYIGVFENTMHMKREVISNGSFWMGAKTYAMLVYDNEGKKYDPPKEKIMGIKVIRSDTPVAVKGILKSFIKKVLLNLKIDKFIEESKKEILSWDSSKLNKPSSTNVLDDYYIEEGNDNFDSTKKGAPMPVKGAINFNYLLEKLGLQEKYQKIEQSDRIFSVYLNPSNAYSLECISFHDKLPEEFHLEEYLDRFKMYNVVAGKFFDDVLKKIKKENQLNGYDNDFF